MATTDYKNAGGEDIQAIMVSVTAPSTLPEGYTFEAYLNDDKNRPFTCEVVRLYMDCGIIMIHSFSVVFRKYLHTDQKKHYT